MQEIYIQDQTIDASNDIYKGEYDHCEFKNYDFGEKDLSGFKLLDCQFIGCNFSLTKVHQTAFRNANFKDCKMLGLRFDDCNKVGLSFSFDGCLLSHSSFYQLNIRQTIFRNSSLQEVDFTECNLGNCLLDNCDLTDALFDHTNLEKADLRNAKNFTIDPEKNRIKGSKFTIHNISGLLRKYDIEIEY